MKKTFLVRRNALLSSTTGMSWGLVALGCALLLVLIRFLAPNFFLHFSTPLFTSARGVTQSVRAFGEGFKNTSALAERNTQLVYENQALAFENQTLIAKLQDLGKFSDPSLPEGIMAGVVMRPPESPYDMLVLSSGLIDDVSLGMKVFGPGGVPIGNISQVTEDFSRVTLFSSPGIITQGWVGETRVPIELHGVGGGAIETSIPRSLTVARGDMVFVSGPGAIAYGVVVEVSDNPSSPQVELRIMPAVHPFSLTWVSVHHAGSSL